MTDQEKLDMLARKKKRLEDLRDTYEGKMIDLDDEISEIESQERANPINIAKKQAQWDALPEEEKRLIESRNRLMMMVMMKDLQPSSLIPYATRRLGEWIPFEDVNIPVSGGEVPIAPLDDSNTIP